MPLNSDCYHLRLVTRGTGCRTWTRAKTLFCIPA